MTVVPTRTVFFRPRTSPIHRGNAGADETSYVVESDDSSHVTVVGYVIQAN